MGQAAGVRWQYMTACVLCCTVLRENGSPQLSQTCQLAKNMNEQVQINSTVWSVEAKHVPKYFVNYDLGDQHPLILNLTSRHEFCNLLAEDASRLIAGTSPFKWRGWQNKVS